jgi:hypothetical protein
MGGIGGEDCLSDACTRAKPTPVGSDLRCFAGEWADLGPRRAAVD